MSDDLIPPTIPEGGGGQIPPKENAEQESTNGQHNNVPTPHGDEGDKAKPILISALLFIACEAIGGICIEIADGLEGYIAMVIHGISLFCIAAGFFAGWHEMVEGKKVSKIWTIYVIVCVFLGFITYLVWRPTLPPQQLFNPAEIKEAVKEALPTNLTALLVSQTNIFNQTNFVTETNQFGKDWRPPLLPSDCEFVSITYGNSAATSPTRVRGWWGAGAINLLVGREYNTNGQIISGVLIGASVRDNRLYVDVTIPGDFPFGTFGTFKLSGNQIEGHLPPTWDMNYDSSAIEIVNAVDVPVCQIIYKRPEVVEIYGIFGNQFQLWEEIPRGATDISPEDWYSGAFDPSGMGLKRIFKYPFWAHKGQRVPDDDISPDYIEGTQFTRDQLDNFFPFGYGVIYLNEDQQKEVHEYFNKKLNWKFDWDSVKIEPNFQAGIVVFSITNAYAAGGGANGVQASFQNVSLSWETKLAPGWAGYPTTSLIDLRGNPVPCSLVLSDNQKCPIFAIGFKTPPN